MPSFHVTAMKDVTARAIRDGHGPFIADVAARLRRGDFNKLWVDAIFQNHLRGFITLEDAFAFAKVWSRIMSGEIGVCEIVVGEGPSADVKRKENQAALDRAFESLFSARVTQRGLGDDDGSLAWSEPINLNVQREESWVCPPRSIPLEIGTTAASRTLLHLVQEGAVARWPYGHELIFVMVSRGPTFSGLVHERVERSPSNTETTQPIVQAPRGRGGLRTPHGGRSRCPACVADDRGETSGAIIVTADRRFLCAHHRALRIRNRIKFN